MIMKTIANKKDITGKTPLYYITKENEFDIRLSDIVQMVIENGGDVTIKDKNGLSPKDMICNMETWTKDKKKNESSKEEAIAENSYSKN